MSKENVRARLSQTLSLRVVAGKASARRSENNAGVEYVENRRGGAGARNGRGGLPVRIQRHHRRREAACLICLCIPSPRRGSGNTSGIGSAERNFGSSVRRIKGHSSSNLRRATSSR